MSYLFLIFTALLSLNTAQAEDLSVQSAFGIGGQLPVTEKVDMSVYGLRLASPGSDALHLYYLGPGMQVTRWWWTSLRFGHAINLPAQGESSHLISGWNYFTIGHVTSFAETDVLISDTVNYFGHYNIRYWWGDFAVGSQLEQSNADFTFGPQFAINVGEGVKTNIQYHTDASLSGHLLRFVLSIQVP